LHRESTHAREPVFAHRRPAGARQAEKIVPDIVDRISSSIRNSQMLRLLSVGFLALLLQIPIAMIGSRVSERQQRRDEAVAEVSSKWGNAQAITGPALVVPYTHRWISNDDKGQPVTRTESRQAVFLPDRLRAIGAIETEMRHRGIFAIPVYRLDLTVEGEFARPDFAKLGIEPAAVGWDRAHLAVGISDVRAIQRETAVSWSGSNVPFLPGTGALVDCGPGVHAMVGVPDGAKALGFSFPLALNGSRGVSFAPFGQTTEVELRSNYPHPSFQGNWLPIERSVSDASFSARWSIPFLGRNYPQAWTSSSEMRDAVEGSRFGVELIDPVDHYRMAERSVKYAGLFILLTFSAVWLIEVLAGVRVHPIQYLMLGSALCLFYLLELSISEHIGFLVSYAIASVSIVAMVAAYCAVILHRVSRAALVGSGVALLYGYLYTLLLNEDFALLAGSIGLFAILGAIMYATRHVDWYAIGSQPREPRASA
jgi:inner membrane protein